MTINNHKQPEQPDTGISNAEIPLALPGTNANAFSFGPTSLLSLPIEIFQEYAGEFKQLAALASDSRERMLYLEMANIWNDAAVKFMCGSDDGSASSSQPKDSEQERDIEREIAAEMGRQRLRAKFTRP